MMFANSLLALAGGLCLAAASPLHAYRAANQTGLPAKTIFQMNATGTWFENIAVRPNGDLLLTTLTISASVYTVKRPYAPHPEASLVHTFDGASGAVGIAETKPDTFAVLAAEYEGVGEPVPGTYAVWEISFKGPAPSVRKITDFPEAQLANGIARVPTCKNDVVLIGDSFAGSLWRLDTQTGKYESVMQVAQMAAPAGGALPLGINGLKVHGGYAYWSNSARVTLYRTKLDKHGYPAANSTIETVAALDSDFVDDFTFDEQGLLWVATNGDNKVDVVRADGSFQTVVGGATEDTVGGDSSVAFGRTALDRNILYVSTSGTLPNNRTEPAKVVAVNRAGFH
ncbi:hypothetical protein F4819DRAFT_471717 [Hypoxylon fuscum]|nr:hypothetical protein F4819DRAFT_471717 [Hypoxylon fuscum]